MERTLRWARRAPRSLSRAPRRTGRARRRRHQPRAGAVRHRAGRRLSRPARGERASRRSAIGFEAYAIGGLSVGEPTDVMYDIVARTTPCAAGGSAALSDGHRHAGRPRRVRSRAASTCSTACCRRATRATDSCSPARGRLNIKNARYAEDDRPLDPELRLLHLPAPFARLSAAPFHGRRDDRGHP